MKKFGDINTLDRFTDALQQMVDQDKNLKDVVTVSCQDFDGGTEDLSNLIRLVFNFNESVEIVKMILSLNSIHKILENPDIKNSIKHEGLLNGTSVSGTQSHDVCVYVFLHKEKLENTNLYKSINGISKYKL